MSKYIKKPTANDKKWFKRVKFTIDRKLTTKDKEVMDIFNSIRCPKCKRPYHIYDDVSEELLNELKNIIEK